jgi:hypothetical protein
VCSRPPLALRLGPIAGERARRRSPKQERTPHASHLGGKRWTGSKRYGPVGPGPRFACLSGLRDLRIRGVAPCSSARSSRQMASKRCRVRSRPRGSAPSGRHATTGRRRPTGAGRIWPAFEWNVGIPAERFRPVFSGGCESRHAPLRGKCQRAPWRKWKGGRPSDRTAGLPPSRVGLAQNPTPATVAET